VGHNGVGSDLLGQACGTRGSLGGDRMPLEHHDALAAPGKMERDAGAKCPSADDHRVGCMDH